MRNKMSDHVYAELSPFQVVWVMLSSQLAWQGGQTGTPTQSQSFWAITVSVGSFVVIVHFFLGTILVFSFHSFTEPFGQTDPNSTHFIWHSESTYHSGKPQRQ